jgi:hypothetical protein
VNDGLMHDEVATRRRRSCRRSSRVITSHSRILGGRDPETDSCRRIVPSRNVELQSFPGVDHTRPAGHVRSRSRSGLILQAPESRAPDHEHSPGGGSEDLACDEMPDTLHSRIRRTGRIHGRPIVGRIRDAARVGEGYRARSSCCRPSSHRRARARTKGAFGSTRPGKCSCRKSASVPIGNVAGPERVRRRGAPRTRCATSAASVSAASSRSTTAAGSRAAIMRSRRSPARGVMAPGRHSGTTSPIRRSFGDDVRAERLTVCGMVALRHRVEAADPPRPCGAT